MKQKNITFEEKLVDIITPYVLQPEQGTAESIIIEILNKIIDEMSYSCNTCLNEIDEFYGRMYGAQRIDVDGIESLVYNLQIMREIKTREQNE